MNTMCSIEPVRHKSLSTTNKLSSRPLSLKLIEKRLTHLRQELQNLTKKDVLIPPTTNDQQTDEIDDHPMQYKKRLAQLLRSHDRQVKSIDSILLLLFNEFEENNMETEIFHYFS